MLTLVDTNNHVAYITPKEESERQAKVDHYQILDTLPEEEFESLVELAAIITGSPVSLMNILDHDRQWSKAVFGHESGRTTPRSETVCQYTIMKDENFEIEDLTKDQRFMNMSYVEGNPKYRSYSGYPLITPEGYKVGALCVLDTKPKKLDETQKKALKTLANEIMARLELRSKQYQLKQLNKEKDLFLRAVNHDIKSPINGIVSSAYYLQNLWDGEKEELFEILSLIEISGHKLINYTSELMSSAMFQNETKLHLDDVFVDELIKDLIHIYAPLAKTKNVELKINCNTPDSFRLDNEKFKLILSNLVSNALKFSAKSDAIIINADIRPNNIRELHCSVTDTGIGIPEEFLPTLFENNKGHQRQGTQGEISTGIGLPLVKQFVELHNGSIRVNTKEGYGAAFNVIIPEQKRMQ